MQKLTTTNLKPVFHECRVYLILKMKISLAVFKVSLLEISHLLRLSKS